MTETVLSAARRYLAAGLSVIPVFADGTKAPAQRGWAESSWWDRLTGKGELERLFPDGVGIGICGGEASGNLEIMDFDRPGAFESWLVELNEAAPSLIHRLPRVHTPNGGRHVYYRLPPGTPIGGHVKLAQAREPWVDGLGKSHTVISETRGRGGYVLAPPSPPECHPSGLPYVLSPGPDITSVPVITVDEWRLMRQIACSFDERAPQQPTPQYTGGGKDRPGDDFEQRASWSEILEPRGWTRVFDREGGRTCWRRPGKTDRGWSATTGVTFGFHVFSSNAHPFEDGKSYSKFAAYTLLEHGGDYAKAASALRAKGYGGKPERVPGADDDKPEAPRRFQSAREVMAEWAKDEKPAVIPTGLRSLDDAIGGGLPVGQVATVIGYSGVGKSEFVRQLRNHAIKHAPAFHIDIELGKRRIRTRDVSQVAQVASTLVQDGKAMTAAQQTKVIEAVCQVATHNWNLWCPSGYVPLSEIRAAIRNEMPDGSLLVVDSLQRIAAWADERDQRLKVQAAMYWLCEIAAEKQSAVLVTSEQKRGGDGRRPGKKDGMTSGAESRAVEFQSDTVIVLSPEGDVGDDEETEAGHATEAAERLIEVEICKTRDGKTGWLKDLIVFKGPCWDMSVMPRGDRTRARLRQELELAEGPVRTETLAKTVGRRKATVLAELKRMQRDGEAVKNGHGWVCG